MNKLSPSILASPQGRLRIWLLPNQGFDTVPGLTSSLAPLWRRHQGRIEVTVRTASSMWRHLLLDLKRPRAAEGQGPTEGEQPDIIQIPSHWTSAFAHLGLLEDLSELGATDLGGWHGLLRPHCVLAGTPQVFSLPWWMEVWVLYYRKDELRRRGLAAGSLSTWDALAAACGALSRHRRGDGIAAIANHNPRDSVSLSDVAPAVWAHGGDFFSPDGARSVFHRPEACEGLRAYLRLLEGGSMPLLGRAGLAPLSLFEGGGAMQFWGRCPPARLRRAGGPIGALPLPGASGRRTGLVTASHLALVRGTPWAREAFDFVTELTRPEAARAYAHSLGAFACVSDWAQGCFRRSDDLAAAFETAMAGARTLPPVAQAATLERILDRSLDRLVGAILRGTYGEEALREELLYAAAEMDAVLAIYGNEST